MARSLLARPQSRWGLALGVAVLAVTGMWAAAHVLQEQEATEPEVIDAAAGDASVDARATTAKAKAGKKPAARGGKTRVAGHAGGAKAPVAPHGGSKSAPATHDPHGGAPTGPSYESALDSNDEQVTIGSKGQADLTDAQLSAPMSDGSFISECGAPDSMSVTVKLAIRAGRAVGVSVETSPPASNVGGCVDGHVRGLSWPVSAKMDSLVTTY